MLSGLSAEPPTDVSALGSRTYPSAFAGAHGSAAKPSLLVKQRRIEPHIPALEKFNRTEGTLAIRLRLRGTMYLPAGY
jgi:hypothetical protein